MEAILMDVKRAMRSLQGMVHAVSGALRRSGVGNDLAGTGRRRGRKAVSADVPRDIYGNRGKADIYSGRDIAELYMMMAYSERPLR